MDAPNLVVALEALDSHERPILLAWATGTAFAVSNQLRQTLAETLGLEVPATAYVAMDYTLDWLYAATRWSANREVGSAAQKWPMGEELKASNQDIDLVIAWVDTQPRLLLLEAKGFTGWRNDQLAKKVARLAVIFDEQTRKTVDVHFLLVGPSASQGLKTAGWPDWLLPGGRLHFIEIPDPGQRYAVQRCLANGTPSRDHYTHWQLSKRKWGTGSPLTDLPT